MPKESEDKRVLTWEKVINKVSDDLVNQPTGRDCCWLIKHNHKSGMHGIHSFKLSTTGTGNRVATHRLLHLLAHIEDYELMSIKGAGGREEMHVSHRCGHGMALLKKNQQWCCINPFHTSYESSEENQDRKGCKYGSLATCIHTPRMF
jgi:hypothetical protein